MFSTTQICQGKSNIFMFKTLCHPFILGTPVRDGLSPWSMQRSSILGSVSPLHHAQLCKVHLFVTTIPAILASTTPYVYVYILYIIYYILYYIYIIINQQAQMGESSVVI
jgi:hypothetical protein